MRIAIVIGSKSIGGAEKQALGLATELKSLGHNSEIIFLRDDKSENKLEFTNFNSQSKQFSFPRNQLNPEFFSQLTIFFRYLKKQKYDIIHSFLPESVLLVAIYKLFCRRNEIHVAGVRGEYFKKFGVREKLYTLLLRKSTAIICNSNSLREVCISEYGISPDLVTVIPNGIKEPLIIPKIRNYPMRAIVVANYHPYKGYDLLFDALARVQLPVDVHIVGRGDFEEIFTVAIQRIPSNVKLVFRGMINAESEYQFFDFAIHPSRTEGMSNAIMEELSHGLPVISFNIGGNSQLVKHMYNGVLVEELNSAQLAHQINFFLENRHFCEILSKQASSSMSIYSFARTAELHAQLYQNLMSNKFN